MAVYTEVSDDALRAFLALYDIGEVTSFKGIAEGVENSNFLLRTTAGQHLLTLFEKRVRAEDLPFFIGLMEHLAKRGVTCPQPVRNRAGSALGELAGRPATIVTFLDGLSICRPDVRHCGELGEALAQMHLAGADFPLKRANALSLEGWPPLFQAAEARADEVAPHLRSESAEELDFLQAHWPKGLPAGIIHADLFNDNVFFLGEKLSGLIDFYFACNDALAYDLAICLSAWCFEPDNSFNVSKGRAMISAYERLRPLGEAEIEALAAAGSGRGAAVHADPARRLAQRAAGGKGRAKESARIPRQTALPPTRKIGRRLRPHAVSQGVSIWTDGACSGNPGPGGWGAVLRYGDREKELKGGEALSTNNRMELTAAIEALRSLNRSCEVILHTDSQYLRGGVTAWIHGWKRNGWRTADKKPVKNEDLWRALDAAAEPHSIDWRWVKGHADDELNVRADQLARDGMAPYLTSPKARRSD